jgi:anti-sigma factor (TIGR02949 family)
MSNSDQSHMKQDCPEKNECLKMLQSILDGEATLEQKDFFIKHHLEECLPCFNNYNLEVTIRQLLKTKCSSEAPQELVDSIKSKVIQNLAR